MPTKPQPSLPKKGDSNDTINNTIKLIKLTYDLSNFFLKKHDYDSDVFKARIKEVRKHTVTVRHSQERIDAISQATTHGNLFHPTGGGHLTDKMYFLVWRRKWRQR